MRFINTSIFIGFSFWILGFALMIAGWLVDVLFEHYGAILAKALYKTGAFIVSAPVIYLLWKMSRWVYAYRLDMVLFLREAIHGAQALWDLFSKSI